ncbi:MAG: hypothetical protein QF384_18175 [Alphaproteobacteria bacterium]|nr:hypothetical protein [Alphaproteobacteria bacterium]MDP6831937.1 hypothetical protein [Alphaproteobacteria bacterium]MDP6873826.1 hypothetical protein [Alphaproteobacteria bacterium]
MDWDTYADAPIAEQYKVNYQATMVMVKSSGEVGRLIAQTSKAKIKALLDKGL